MNAGFGGDTIPIDVAVCTFRRPFVEATLRSIAACRIPAGIDRRVIVIDNDDSHSARERIEAAARETGMPVRIIHAPGRNISIARNAALDAADGRLLAFVDDDETVSAEWLESLVDAWRASRPAAVLGPVDAVYPDDAPAWMTRGDFHATRPVWVDGRIVTGYTCNALLDLGSPAVAGRRFRLELGRSGGEDTEYFQKIVAAGGTIVYAETALAFEPVPPERASFRWLLLRRYRAGQTHGRLIRERGRSRAALAFEAAKAAAKAVSSLAVAALTGGVTLAGRAWTLRGTLHLGVVSSLLGGQELQLYGGAESRDVAAR